MKRSLRNLLFLLPAAMVLSHCAPAPTPLPPGPKPTQGWGQVFSETSDRYQSPGKYFAKEVGAEYFADTAQGEKQTLRALAFSGGGIRSNGFHIGYLAGLIEEGLMDKFQYISSVSGGGWAHGSFQAFEGDNQAYLACLEDTAKKTNYQDFLKSKCRPIFRNMQFELTQPWWRSTIVKTSLLGKDIPIKELIERHQEKNRPYPLFMASALYEKQGFGSMDQSCGELRTYEFTPYQLGTSVACKPQNNKLAPKGGIYAKNLYDKLQIDEQTITGKRYNYTETMLATAMSASSTFSPTMDFYLQPTEEGTALPLMEWVKLTDGGQADNTGMTNLVERRADVIVSTYLGYEENDPNIDDNKNFANLTSKYFQDQIHFDCPEGFNKCYPVDKTIFRIATSCKTAKVKGCGAQDIYVIRPTKAQMDGFLKALKTTYDRPDLAKMIEEAYAGNTKQLWEDFKKDFERDLTMEVGSYLLGLDKEYRAVSEALYGKEKQEALADLEQQLKDDFYAKFPMLSTIAPSYQWRYIQAYYYLGKWMVSQNREAFLKM